MEMAQLCNRAYNNQLQQSIYLCHWRKMSQIWQVNTLANQKGRNMMHTYTPLQCPTYTLWNPRNSPDKIL